MAEACSGIQIVPTVPQRIQQLVVLTEPGPSNKLEAIAHQSMAL
jgi:hypothetical protein